MAPAYLQSIGSVAAMHSVATVAGPATGTVSSHLTTRVRGMRSDARWGARPNAQVTGSPAPNEVA